MTEKAIKAMSLLRLAEERASLRKKLDEKTKKQQLDSIPYLPNDCISNILIRLPLESLQRSRFVCKPWFNIIKAPKFIEANLLRAKTVLIFLTPLLRRSAHHSQLLVSNENPKTFSLEPKILQIKSVHPLHQPLIHPTSKLSIAYMVISDGKSTVHEYNATCLGQIRAGCNGLIVLDNKMKNGELVIMNPVTRELGLLPLGTIYPPHEQSFALAYCVRTKGYKLVHLFRDESQFIGCEVLRIGDKSWRVVDGPCFGLLAWFGYEPVSAMGALHWVPEIDHSEHIVSMTIHDEKFHKIVLPKSCRSNDRLMVVFEHLCLVTHEEMNEISVWSLESLTRVVWTKIYTITVGCIRDLIPLYFSRHEWEIYFMDKDGSMFAFDFNEQVMRRVERTKGSLVFHGASYLLHVNSLVSWRVKDLQIV